MNREAEVTLLRTRLESGEFAVTAQLDPDVDDAVLRHSVEPLRGRVDAVTVTDNAGAFVRTAAWAGSLIALGSGVEPIMQVGWCHRNRIALQSDLLSAAALGITNVLLEAGDHPREGDHPEAKPVADLDTPGLLAAARAMRDDGRLLSGRELTPAPELFLGTTHRPGGPDLAAEVEAGAQFVQTRRITDIADIEAFAGWMSRVRDAGLHRRCHILAGVGTRDHDVTGSRRCAELIDRIRDIPGIAGVHIVAPPRQIPAVLDRAGFTDRASPDQLHQDRWGPSVGVGHAC